MLQACLRTSPPSAPTPPVPARLRPPARCAARSMCSCWCWTARRSSSACGTGPGSPRCACCTRCALHGPPSSAASAAAAAAAAELCMPASQRCFRCGPSQLLPPVPRHDEAAARGHGGHQVCAERRQHHGSRADLAGRHDTRRGAAGRMPRSLLGRCAWWRRRAGGRAGEREGGGLPRHAVGWRCMLCSRRPLTPPLPTRPARWTRAPRWRSTRRARSTRWPSATPPCRLPRWALRQPARRPPRARSCPGARSIGSEPPRVMARPPMRAAAPPPRPPPGTAPGAGGEQGRFARVLTRPPLPPLCPPPPRCGR